MVNEIVSGRLMYICTEEYVADVRHSEALAINSFCIEHAEETFIVVFDTFNPAKPLPPSVDYIVGGFTMGLNLGADFVPKFHKIAGSST